jgi:uncharacterized protein YjbI with pentapeptide repeats
VDLSGANLSWADLRKADLSKADLSGADLWGCIGNMEEIKTLEIEKYQLAYTHDRLQIGCENHAISEWFEFDDARISAMDCGALEWWQKWRDVLKTIIEMSPATH